MSLFKNPMKISENNTLPLSQLGYFLSSCEGEQSPDFAPEIINNAWDLFNWMAYFLVLEKKISQKEVWDIYNVLGREPQDPKFSYQKNVELLGAQAERFYAQIQSIFRPHLSVAFLPSQVESDTWPVTGKSFKSVKVQKDFGMGFPSEILGFASEYDFSHLEDGELEFFSILVSQTFIYILKLSNNDFWDRKTRLSMRLGGYSVLPFFLIFLLARHLPEEA